MPDKEPSLRTLGQLLDRFEEAARDEGQVTVGMVVNEIGHRSFGPLLLLAGLVTMAPVIGDIPGVPAIMGVMVFILAVQLIFHRKHFWLPRWILNRSVKSSRLTKAVRWTRRPAHHIDCWLRPRMTILIHGAGRYVIALCCLLIALVLPFLEVIPFSANFAGAALTAFGLALIAHDGLLALLAFTITIGTAGAIAYSFF